jgi:hypothetical protein
MKAISVCLNRFDDDTKASFLDLYTKVDAGASVEQILAPVEEPEVVDTKDAEEIPF